MRAKLFLILGLFLLAPAAWAAQEDCGKPYDMSSMILYHNCRAANTLERIEAALDAKLGLVDAKS